MQHLKIRLYNYCLEYIESRMQAAQNAIANAQEASKSETKSSAGDKYETGRAMMQQEIDRNSIQFTEAAKLKQVLLTINPEKQHDRVQQGSLVETNKGRFYLAISAGQISIDGEIIYAISPGSPIGISFAGKAVGDEAVFNGTIYKITKIT